MLCLLSSVSGITHFARILRLEYEDWESTVRQESVDNSMILSETGTISVEFFQDGRNVAPLELVCMSE